MRALIVGCNGLLGQSLAAAAPPGAELAGIGQEPEPVAGLPLRAYARADISRRADLEGALARLVPDRIFNAAAITNVDLCETERDLCRAVNGDAVAWMAAAGKPLVHISTDYVFDGAAGPYAEEDRPNPLSHYGRVKLESEAHALSRPGNLVARTMLLWGRAKGMKPSFVEFVKGSLEAGKGIRIVTDQHGNPTAAPDLARALWALALGGHAGLYHVCGWEGASRHAWALAIADHYGLDPSLVSPCLTSDLGQAAPRPLRSGLKTDKVFRATGLRLGGIREQLAAYG